MTGGGRSTDMKASRKVFEPLEGLRVYRPVLAAFPRRTWEALLLNPAATVFEGSALIALIPLIQLATGDTVAEGERLSSKIAAALSFFGLELSIPLAVGLFALLAAASAGLTFLATYRLNGLGAQVQAFMRRRLFNALIQMDWPALAREKSGALTKAVLQDSYYASSGLVSLITSAGAILSSAVYLLFASLISLNMIAPVLAFVILTLPIYWRMMREGDRSGRKATEAFEHLSADTTELLLNAKRLFSQGQRGYAIEKFADTDEAFLFERLYQDKLFAGIRLIFELGAVIFISLLLLLMLWIQQGSVSTVLVFLVIFARLAPRAVIVQRSLFRAVTFGNWLLRWQARLDEALRARASLGGDLIPTYKEGLELRDVTFRFLAASEPVVESVSVHIAPLECVAFVGLSGQGKSTILDLFSGLLAPTAGEVLLDGRSLQDIDHKLWQRRIGLVLQECPLFHATIAENIVFGLDAGNSERLKMAARFAGALDFIEAMPNGFDTVVGERGARLSGGQRQRIALAQALYCDPWILILDEVTSALDAESSAAIVASLRQLKGRVSLVIVSHQSDMLSLADRVYEVTDRTIHELKDWNAVTKPQFRAEI